MTLHCIRRIQVVLLLTFALAATSQCAAAADRKPNIIVIVADDLGYGDIGVHGCTDIPTPHIDSLARDGVRCTQAYLCAPQCSPTRAGFLPGRYQQRFGHEHNRSYPDSAMPLTEKTIADRLKAAGYATGLVGKWHLGSDEQHHPMSRGFDEFFGFLGGGNPFLPDPKTGTIPGVMRNKQPANEKEYLTDAFGREAVAFVERHRELPFFLYLSFNAPHLPLEATPKYLERFKSIEGEPRRTCAAMISAMDDAVGVLLARLKSTNLDDDTLVFFLSDNGGPTRQNGSRNTPLTGVKGEVHEGGIRTPLLVRWPARLGAGRLYDRPVIQLDIHATALALAGVPLPTEADAKLDGVDLVPYLTNERQGNPHDVLYWRFTFPPNRPEIPRWAIRHGDWKLLCDVDAHDPNSRPITRTRKLINLAADPQEKTDLSAEHPDKAKSLEAAWKKWESELVTPAPDAGDPRRGRAPE
jgi:arylsulfatase A-like enzyme